MATAVLYNSYDLQTDYITTREIQQFEASKRNLNIQGFSALDGGKLVSAQFPPKTFVLKGMISGTSKADLEDRIDDLKKELLTPTEANLTIGYISGYRTFVCSCNSVNVDRKHYTIDAVDWEAEFVVSNPPHGKDSSYTTINFYGKTNTFATTTTGTHTGSHDWGGTVSPSAQIKVTFSGCSSVEKFKFVLTNADGFTTTTTITRHFNSGDVLIIDNDEGTIKVNGTAVDFDGGFPRWTLDNNSYSVKITGRSYTVNVQFIYYKLWL